MPGGFGTLDEACEVIPRKQLGLLKSPIFFININNYWSSFFAFIADAEKEQMIVTANRDTFHIYKSVEHYFGETHD
jgi:predicted Rossmann-fold nucleotide-binding protein